MLCMLGFHHVHKDKIRKMHKYLCYILYSWDRASLDMEILYMTNKMRLIMIFIITNALHVSGVIAHHQELMNSPLP
jgi:hypothetical protein